MSEKERAIQLLDAMPESQIAYVIGYIQGLTANKREIEEIQPDEWDLQMIEQAKRENDGTTTSLDELLKRDGLSYADLRD